MLNEKALKDNEYTGCFLDLSYDNSKNGKRSHITFQKFPPISQYGRKMENHPLAAYFVYLAFALLHQFDFENFS